MEKIKFNVSSKTARLIGRENISDSNGAIIELVKNAYDADADSVYIKFDIIFENIPEKIAISETKDYFNKEEYNVLASFYEQKGDVLIKKNNLTAEQEQTLKSLLFSKNSIIILDNGSGMDENIIKTIWMNIGTSDKEINTYSKKGRIKTGAKGIGRFALEKLSQKTTVYSKTENEKLVYWNLDWMQFDKKDLLDEINADVGVLDSSFNDIVSQYIDQTELEQKNINFNSGTLIILSGTREIWGDRIYNRINNNLNSINPFGNVDIFNVYINNIIKKEYSYSPQSTFLSEDDYDYIINADYDGEKNVSITLTRNEVNLSSVEEQRIINNEVYKFNINDFWKRSAFKTSPYKKEEYSSILVEKYDVLDLMSKASLEEIKKIGKFNLQLYFLKSGKSEFSIIKDIKVNRRKKLLSSFSGIKIYRDNFKVRPYGEEGPMYDWLQLGSRVQSSPAGITHPTGSWRVNTYQLIGNVNISRINNPNLEDMANREGLALNDTYYLFVELIQNIISKFEYDRQYVYREYGAWLKKNIDAITPTAEIQKSVIDEKEKNQKNEFDFSKEEYKEAMYQTINDKRKSVDIQRIMMNFSSVGVTANTFAHEMKSISTNLSTRNRQLKICIDNILKNKEFDGPEFLNPYNPLENGEQKDILLSKWLKLIMDSVNKVNSKMEKISLIDFFKELYDDWNGLLEKKSIKLSIPDKDECCINCEKTDLYLVFNNLILNSAYFLEQEINGNERLINIDFKEEKDYIIFIFQNNGPKLDKKYMNTPDIIFEAGETTKENGTGLGLWICKDSVQRNNGEIHVVPCDMGFKIEIKWPKVD
ncbi:MAG: sensor histidine kinase [Bacilli bacterium]|nr:sensor histidine kinase [Bacilli bacterium]